MLDWIQVVALSLIQGLTEFLPISSSAHLILLPKVMGWQDQGLDFDVAVHIGTLIAVLVYFRREISIMLRDFLLSLLGKPATQNSRLAWYIGIGTIPAGIAGLLCKSWIENSVRPHAVIVIACTTIVFGLLLGYASGKFRNRTEYDITWRDAILIGCAQILALIPGTSRSGITMTAGLLLGLSRQAAAKFSFYMSIPVILSAGGLEVVHLLHTPTTVLWQQLLVGIMIASISAFCCIHLLLKLLVRFGLMPFVIYRLALGISILYWLYP